MTNVSGLFRSSEGLLSLEKYNRIIGCLPMSLIVEDEEVKRKRDVIKEIIVVARTKEVL
jgi:hypothetical protein